MPTAIKEPKKAHGKRRTDNAAVASSCIVTVINETEVVNVPPWVVDLESFRRWADTDDYPEKGRIWYLKGQVWIDMSREQVFTHGQVKTEYSRTISNVVMEGDLGLFLTDGAFFTNIEAQIAGKPDGLFVSNESIETGRVKLVEGRHGGYVELAGTPDLVLEVISRSSVRKDTEILRKAYWEAGINEYWLVDVRKEPLQFDILRHNGKGYVASRKQDGWIRSAVLGKAFQLTQQTNRLGQPSFILAVR